MANEFKRRIKRITGKISNLLTGGSLERIERTLKETRLELLHLQKAKKSIDDARTQLENALSWQQFEHNDRQKKILLDFRTRRGLGKIE